MIYIMEMIKLGRRPSQFYLSVQSMGVFTVRSLEGRKAPLRLYLDAAAHRARQSHTSSYAAEIDPDMLDTGVGGIVQQQRSLPDAV